MARRYQCPECHDGVLGRFPKDEWPDVQFTVKGFLRCDRCEGVFESPAPAWLCTTTIMLGTGMFAMAFLGDIYPWIGRLVSGEESNRGFLALLKAWGAMIFGGTISIVAWRTWRYSREFVKAQAGSPGKHRDS